MKTLVNIFCLILTLLALFVRSQSNQTTEAASPLAEEYDREVFKTLDDLELELLTDKLALLKKRLDYLESTQ